MDTTFDNRKLTKGDRAVMRAVQSWRQGPRALFLNAINRKGASLLEGILRENAIQADGAYLCLARDRYLAGRSDVNALKIAEGRRKRTHPLSVALPGT
jgi:hypothetical protein